MAQQLTIVGDVGANLFAQEGLVGYRTCLCSNKFEPTCKYLVSLLRGVYFYAR